MPTVDAGSAAAHFGVSAQTIRRWVRGPVPVKRRAELEALILPSAHLLEQEDRELEYAKWSLERVYGGGEGWNPSWGSEGWLEPHVVAIVGYDALGVTVARIANAAMDQKTRYRLRAGGVELEMEVFPNRFAAEVAKGLLLLEVAPWRVVIAKDVLSRGRTESWMVEASRHRLSWFVDNAPVKQPARRPRSRAAKKRS